MKRLIFDFDGTIADSMWVIISIYEQMLHAKVTPEQVEHIRGLTAAQAIKELKVPLWKAPRLLTQGKKIMTSRLSEVKPCPGVPELLQQLHAEGHELRIMSSNSTQNVRTFLQQHNLKQYFTSVEGGVGLFVKAPAIRKIIKQNHLPKHEVMYIGDEARDIEGAKKALVPIISVGWGYNSPELLRTLKPDYFVTNASEIVNIVRGHSA